ncbi:MAG: hypothetical protein ACPLN0_06690 [Candidatus Hydrothermia bacterium]
MRIKPVEVIQDTLFDEYAVLNPRIAEVLDYDMFVVKSASN